MSRPQTKPEQGPSRSRVILLLDLDCFYAQVEQKRCGISRDVPCAVQQWEGLIAINYAARACGVTRHMRAPEAKLKCPEIVLIHVQTIGGEDEEVVGADAAADTLPPTDHNSRQTQKACLERYRTASAAIMGVIRKLAPNAPVEKASIDEAYVDVTGMVEEELRSGAPDAAHSGDDEDCAAAPPQQPGGTAGFGWGSIVIDGPLRVDNEFERRLSIGAMIACRLRGAVNEQLGYTMSAGIACNKLLAKVASGLHKPNQQTVVPPRAAEGLLADMQLGKIRNFGGKLGAELGALGCSTAGQVAKLPMATLEAHFGERASWIAAAMRGISDEPVQEKELPKSMLAAKSFNATSDWKTLQRWLGILAAEIAERMTKDALAHRRHPRNLVLHYRASNGGATTAAGRTRTCAMPYFGRQQPHADAIAAAALKLAQTTADILPAFQLGLSATEFVPAPVAQNRSIQRFFSSASVSTSGGGPAAAGAPAPADNSTQAQDRYAAEPSDKRAALQQPRPSNSRPGPAQGTLESLFSRAPVAKQSPTGSGDGSGASQQPGGQGAAKAAKLQGSDGGSEQAAQQLQPPAVLRTLRLAPPATHAAAPAVSTPTTASPAAASPFGSPFSRGLGSPFANASSSPFAAATTAAADEDADVGVAGLAGPAAADGASPAASSGSGGLRRSRDRRSPTAAVVAARRSAFHAAADAAAAAVSGSPVSSGSESASALARSEKSDASIRVAVPDVAADLYAVAAAMQTDQQPCQQLNAAEARQLTEAEPAQAAPAAPKCATSDANVLTRAFSFEGWDAVAAVPGKQTAGRSLSSDASPATAAAAEINASGGRAAPPPEPASDDVLGSIDVQEQRRILRDIEIRQRLDEQRSRNSGGGQNKKRGQSGGIGGTKRGRAAREVAAGQMQLSGFFVTKQ